jgi:hypothetical protein
MIEEQNEVPVPAMAFGREAWIQYIGDSGDLLPGILPFRKFWGESQYDGGRRL